MRVNDVRLAIAQGLSLIIHHVAAGGFEHGLRCGRVPLAGKAQARVEVGLAHGDPTKL